MMRALLALFLCSSVFACASDERELEESSENESAPDADTQPGAGADAQPGLPDANTEAGAADAAPAGPCTTLSYENFGQAFFAANCTTCHSTDSQDRQGAPLSKNWDTLDNVRAGASRIRIRAAIGTTMPPALAEVRPSDEDRAKLAEWLACGAP